MLKCFQICPWNYSCIGIGCKKPDNELCPMSNVREQPKTNADRIRAMSDRELADFLAAKFADIHTQCAFEKEPPTATQLRAIAHTYFCAWVQWLQQPAEEGNRCQG